MKKYVKVYNGEDYRKEYDDMLENDVEYVYVGVYDDGEDYEESSRCGYMYKDGRCMIVGCRSDFEVSFSDMMKYLYEELDSIEKCYAD